MLPAQTDPDDLRAKLVPIAKIKKGFATFCNMNITLFALTELQQSDSLEGILNLLRRSLKRAVFLAQRCIAEFSDVDSGVSHKKIFFFGDILC
ncbi:unnamed protein product [Gongylonema pulchrum]|uniref:Uncharacterized protein n=1 Tax=Gongylonema pulchrum TaxID=637853 RepID=A0A3P7PKY5_9BILA|nr:unnamed protein product [Gongylonema pulchrum]